MVLATIGSVATAAPPGLAEGEAARILVQARAGVPAARLDGVLRGAGAVPAGQVGSLPVRIARVPEHARDRILEALSRNPHVAFAEPDEAVAPALTADDPRYDDAWHLQTMEAPAAWDDSLGTGMVVAVADTGVDATHPDLSGKLLSGWNTVSNNTDITDEHGHGTKVAGTVGAVSDNALGVTSLAWDTMILPIRISERSDGVAYWSDIAEAITYAADQGADVVNVSYLVAGSSTIINAGEYLQDHGGVLVTAGGNGSTDPGYADSPYVMAVAATNKSDGNPSWSNYGAYIDVSAPGVDIWTTRVGGNYGTHSGTSFSSPATAAVVALMRAANTALSPTQLEELLERSAVDLGAAGRDDHYGWGRVDAAAAVAAARGAADTDTEAPTVAIDSPAGGASVSGDVAVDVSASDNEAVSEVTLFADGAEVATDTSTPWAFSWDSTAYSGDVTLLVEAYDGAGNASTDSVVVSVTEESTTDTEAPTVAIASPADGDTVSGSVSVDVSASDNDTVDQVVLYVDGSAVATDTAAPWEFTWDSATASGDVTLTAEAEDASGNAATDSVAVSVSDGTSTDTEAPTVSIHSPADGATVRGHVDIHATAADEGGVARMTVVVDGATVCSASSAELSCRWNSRKVSAGDHVITVTAEDTSGNRGDAAATVTVADGNGNGNGKGKKK